MLKGYYILPHIDEKDKGIKKKIEYQIQLFENFSTINKIILPYHKFTSIILSRLPFGSEQYDYQIAIQEMDLPNYVYIRQGTIDKGFIDFLKRLRMKFARCKIIYEIPAYPYDQVYRSKIYNYFKLKKDKKYREALVNYVDRIVTYSHDERIFGIKTIMAHNGVDCDKILPISCYNLKKDVIRLIAVATMNPWHGYERIFHGMHNYYLKAPAVKIYFSLVGAGNELSKYKKMVKELNLEHYVKFVGIKTGTELDDMYNDADMAISSLGMYKYDFEYVSTLKSCEYMAKGLPVVAGYDDYVLENNPFCLHVSNDGSDICIENIVDFYNMIYKYGKEDVVNRIRKIAFNKADIKNSYKNVVSYIME